MVYSEGSGATNTLLSNYAATPMQTPAFRTPARTPARGIIFINLCILSCTALDLLILLVNLMVVNFISVI